jgi:hypothetical protein
MVAFPHRHLQLSSALRNDHLALEPNYTCRTPNDHYLTRKRKGELTTANLENLCVFPCAYEQIKAIEHNKNHFREMIPWTTVWS